MSRRHADNWNHPSHYLVDPYTWPWSPNGHDHGHEWPTATFVQCQLALPFWDTAISKFDHENPWSRSCVWSKVKVTFDLQNSKVKVMVKFKPIGHIWGLEFNRYVCFSFRGNRTTFGWVLEIPYLTLKIQGQGHGQGQTRWSYLSPKVQSICLLFVSWQSDHFWLRYSKFSQLALRRWPNVGIGRHRRDRQPTSRQRWYSVACVATVCWHSVGARRLAYRSLPMFCVWTSVVGIKCFSNKCCRSTRLSIHQLHI